MKTIAVDLGGSSVKLGVVADGVLIDSAKINCRRGQEFQAVAPEIEVVCKKWQRSYGIDGLGIAFPSLVDPVEKRVLGHNNKFPDGVDFPFADWAKERLGLPAVLENDANAAALGEWGYGAAQGTGDFALMILGTGIGIAAVMEGRLVRGRHYQAGNMFGHIPLKRGGRPCRACPGTGCAEAQASTWALKDMAADSSIDSPLKQEPDLNFKLLRQYYDKGDALARELFQECCGYWANCLIGLAYAYDPEVLVLSGGVLNWGPELPECLFQEVDRRVWTPWGKIQYRLAKNPEHSVLLGLHYAYHRRLEGK
ncbi:ROK family protein [Acutalibacter sp. 1XD8-33]|uniref:ROK family protein n=1 Tax=Acutalibacter sp. 1XD8-33 TaxID=2320081 RepID=UPI000EA2EBDA|nr:ROK family protein [Acutalibacter sp. 1XD8-33]RKJ38756.1 ROK family protein [Acutalibacter sp. 1XD8-33]